MKSFRERERGCEMTFQNCLPCWHVYSCGKNMPILFANDDDNAFVMNVIAQGWFQNANDVKILAFEVMNNHLHFVVSGNKTDIDEMLSFISKRIKRAISLPGQLIFNYKPIEDLTSMRNHIVYVHRNGYVVNSMFTPFSYPWGSGAYYFMPERKGQLFSEINSINNRSMFRSRDVNLPSNWKVIDGYVTPDSFCAIDTGMAMFRDAHQYFMMTSKSVEAYSGIAVELNDDEFLTDQEIFTQILQDMRNRYNVGSIRELTNAQRLELARNLHYNFRSSNGQIRRILGLTQFEVDSLFPISR